jgi:hypothetical protein
MSVLAGRQDGVVSLLQLFELGFTYREVRRLVAKGVLHPVHRGVFAVGHPKVTSRGRLRAALMACGETAFLSGRTAAVEYGLRVSSVPRTLVDLAPRESPVEQLRLITEAVRKGS